MNAFPKTDRAIPGTSPAPASTLARCEALGRQLRALAAAPGDLGLLEAVLLDLRAIPGSPCHPALASAQSLASAGQTLLQDLRGGLLPATAQAIELLFETEAILGVLVEDLRLQVSRQGPSVVPDSSALLARMEALTAPPRPSAGWPRNR